MSSFIDPENVSLDNLAGGAAVERFNLELARVLANIDDPNTPAKTKRKVKLTVTLTPSADRDYATADITCESTLAPLESFSMPLYIGKDVTGKVIARQTHFKQQTIAGYQAEQSRTSTHENIKPFERKNA